MFSRVRKMIGAVLVLIGFFFAVGLAGSSDVGSISFFKAAAGVIGCLVLMGSGAKLIGGEEE